MTARAADALVFFGATGDLAYRKTFPALQELARRGRPFRVTPDQTIAIASLVKLPGETLRVEPVELIVSEHLDPIELVAYEELLHDALEGSAGRFARQDYVEEAWRIVDPVLDDATPVFEYDPESWGPAEAAARIAPAGGWIDPGAR